MFSEFERLTDKYGAFKVATIGDCFVCVTGVPYADVPVDAAAPPSGAAAAAPGDAAAGGRRRSGWSRRLAGLGLRGSAAVAPEPLPPQLASPPPPSMTAAAAASAAAARAAVPSTLGAVPPPWPHIQWAALSPAARAEAPAAARHAAVMLRFALDVVGVVRAFRHPITGAPLQMRVGLHTGAVTGGVVGTKSFRYDIYGPDVLAAASMEAHGVAGGIAVSGATRDALLALNGTPWALPGVSFIAREPVDVKGKGRVTSFAVGIEGADINLGLADAESRG
jgi:class 3 adenylate cyclase